MLNTKINVIKEIKENSIIMEFEKELKNIKNQNLNNLIKNNLLIDGKDYYFYPIIIDIEIEPNGGLFLVGFYFPFSDKYFSFIFDKGDSIEYIEWIKSELINILKFFKNNSFSDYKNKNNLKIYPILVGHNIIKYDFILLFHFLFNNIRADRSFYEMRKLSDIIIDVEKPNKYIIYKKAAILVYREIKNFFCLDTLLCVNTGEAKSLFRFKTDIFFDSNKEKIPPLEFDLNNVVLKNDSEALNHLCQYNLNDLYYTYRLLFFSTPKKRIESRCLLYKNLTPKQIGFAESINKFDSLINCLYIIEKTNIDRRDSYINSQNTSINIKNIHFLHDYYYSNTYLNFFKEKNIYKISNTGDGIIDINNIKVNMGIGGLHSITQKISSREKYNYHGSQLIFASSNENYLTIILDFQSFYVNIILQLLNHIQSFSSEKDVIQELNKIRLELKKKKDPNDAIFKISTLAYTGSLNDYRSSVYHPLLYLSMTLNGQLLCLELLYFLNKKIEKIIEVNTDGVIIYIKKENYNDIINLCDQFEKDYNFKIDTREIISFGLFFTANKKIIVTENQKLTVKGFKKGLSFGFFTNTLIRWVKENLKLLENINNCEDYKIKLYMSLWQSFCKQVGEDKKNNNIKNYLNSETIQKTKLIVYFSKKPDYFGGLPSKSKVILHPYPIKKIDFRRHEDPIYIKKYIMDDLDISSYWSYLTEKLSTYFFYNIKNDFEIINPIMLNDSYDFLKKAKKVDIPFFYLKNKKLISEFYKLSIFGFVVFMKDRDKKSFPKKKMSQSNLINILNENKKLFYKHMLENYTYGMCNGVAVCVNLKESWENDICCIDFDGVEWFFKEEHFNEKTNIKQKAFLDFILSIKQGGFLVYSSMTNTPFDRFKLFFKINNKPKDLIYNKFKKIHQESHLNFDFNIEDVSSISGTNLYGQKLINLHKFKQLKEVDFESYNNFFIDKSDILCNDQINFKKNKYLDLLVQIFYERDYDQRILYNNLLEKNKSITIFHYNKYKICKESFIQIFIEVIKKENKNNLYIKNKEYLLKFYKFTFENNLDIKKEKNLFSINDKVNKKINNNLKKVILNDKPSIILPSNNFIKIMQELEFTDYQINFNDLDKIIPLLNEIFDYFNKEYNTTFKYTENVEDNILYHSNCIFKDDNGNNKQVTAYINKYLQCKINCYHDSCKDHSRYIIIENNINSNLYSIITLNTSTPFTLSESSISSIISEYCNK